VTNADSFKTKEEYDKWINDGYQQSSQFRTLLAACQSRVYPICNDEEITRKWLSTARTDIINACARIGSYDLSSYITNMDDLRKRLFEIATSSDDGCIGFGQNVQVLEMGKTIFKEIQSLSVGDQVLTTSGFSTYLGELHPAGQHATRSFHFGNGEYLQLTDDHVVGGRFPGQFMLSKQVEVGAFIGEREVKEITYEKETWTCCPLTRAGTIVVNGAPVSCFACCSHWIARLGFLPLTHLSLSSPDIPLYVANIRKFHASLPRFVRQLLPVYV